MTNSFKRVASGSFAMWSRMGVTIGFQVALVPLYLNYWSAKVYGAWLAVQAAFAMVTLLDMAHQTFLENEFLKIGRNDLVRLRRILYSAVPVGLMLSAAQLIFVWIVNRVSLFGMVIGLPDSADEPLRTQAFWVLTSWCFAYMSVQSIAGLIGRALAALGYFSRFAWWGLLYVFASTMAPALVLVNGGSFLQVGIAQAVVTVIYHTIWGLDAFRILRREKLPPCKPEKDVAAGNLRGAGMVLLKSILELSRLHGFRIFLAPIVGLQRLAEFSTQRTIANVALQSLNGVYGPLMPEMMRYVRMREQEKMECAFAMLWCLLILLICPMVLVLQAGMPLVYTLWTRGRFPYDPLLLSFISSSILIYAIGLPAMAVCVGNNLVKAQLRIAIFASSCLFGSLWFLVHFFGLRGAALALVTGELVSLGLYVRHAANWLRSVHLRWPRRAFLTAVFAVGATQIGASLIAVLPMIALPMCIGFIAVNLACFIIVWQSLPDSMAQEMKAKILLRVGLLRHWHSGIQ